VSRLKRLVLEERGVPPLRGGHALCQGCGVPMVVRTVLDSIHGPTVVVNATGCLEVATTRYPTTAWNVPWLHVAFENAAAVASGVESAYRALRRRGALPDGDLTFVVFAGDGGTYDIGLQALSGALERRHRFLFVCYDNEAYMNTGVQRSGATPFGASATAERAAAADGPAFLNVLTDCPLGWGHEPRLSQRVLTAAVESRFWPLYEVADGRYRLTYRPERPVSVDEWLAPQKRFAHLLRPENRGLVDAIQARVDADWDALLARCEP
jgi:pyruvate ferredoxin oxidoreductase beta subunit